MKNACVKVQVRNTFRGAIAGGLPRLGMKFEVRQMPASQDALVAAFNRNGVPLEPDSAKRMASWACPNQAQWARHVFLTSTDRKRYVAVKGANSDGMQVFFVKHLA